MPDLAAPVRQVTVYPDRALVTRTGSVELEAGEHRLRVADLPRLLPESLRAAVRGPAGTRLVDVDLTTAFHAAAPEPEIAELEQALERLRAEAARVDARAAARADRREWLRGVGARSRDFARGLAQGTIKPQDCEDTFGFLAEQALRHAEEEVALGADQRRLAGQIEAATRELARRRGGESPDRMEARLTVALAQPGRCEVDVGYQVPDASWEPAYDVRVEPGTERVQLTSLGTVRQRTGERWAGVALALSTARPSAAAAVPEPAPWYLRVPQPPAVRPLAAHRIAAPGGVPEPDLVPAAEDVAEVDRSGPSVVFRIARPVHVDADGSPHKVTIDAGEMPCRLDRVTAPAMDAVAHIHATVTNATGHILLGGDASVFHAGDFVGTVRIPQTAPGANDTMSRA